MGEEVMAVVAHEMLVEGRDLESLLVGFQKKRGGRRKRRKRRRKGRLMEM